ncbi:MAG: hypothetical protein K2K08_05320 [Paramuribaculum sp.]|nr:hypothetical protein [Paramuribaculum sp.]
MTFTIAGKRTTTAIVVLSAFASFIRKDSPDYIDYAYSKSYYDACKL